MIRNAERLYRKLDFEKVDQIMKVVDWSGFDHSSITVMAADATDITTLIRNHFPGFVVCVPLLSLINQELTYLRLS